MEERFDYDGLLEVNSDLRKQLADAQATVEALQAIIKQMGEQAAILAKDGMAAKAQVEALQRGRDEAIEDASLPTRVCDGCGRVSSEGWINRVIESLDGTDYEMECPVCGVRAIEEDCASDLVRERDDLQAALDAEREKVSFLEKKNVNLVEASNIVLKVKADQDKRISAMQTELTQLQAFCGKEETVSEAICTCHCGGSMFYRHLHAESCVLSREGEEAPKSELETLRDERDRLRAALVKCRRELWYCNNQLKYMGATEGYSVTEALCEAGAALTPAGQRLTPNEATE